jgi:hypothetical protein
MTITVGCPQTNRKTDTGKTLKRWPVLVDHYKIMKNTNTGALSLRVIGIFKEHHKKKKQQLVASAFDSFSKELIML